MKIGFISLGCPKNLVDSEVMLGLTRAAGHTLTPDPSDADVLVVNTCAFIDSAKQESIDAILEMAAHKRNGTTRLVVTGCLAERYGEELRREISEIDVVLGTNEVPDIVEAITAATGLKTGDSTTIRAGGPTTIPAGGPALPVKMYRRQQPGNGESQIEVLLHDRRRASALPTYIYDANTPRILTTPRHYAYVKIAEGCDYKCAFCIIPKLRGDLVSRPAKDVLLEAEKLVAANHHVEAGAAPAQGHQFTGQVQLVKIEQVELRIAQADGAEHGVVLAEPAMGRDVH